MWRAVLDGLTAKGNNTLDYIRFCFHFYNSLRHDSTVNNHTKRTIKNCSRTALFVVTAAYSYTAMPSSLYLHRQHHTSND